MSPISFLCECIIIASGAAFLLIVFEKKGVVEYLQMNATKIFGRFKELPTCNFCLLFWICFLISLPLIVTSNIFYIIAPAIAAPIAKRIYENNHSARK
jgi:hypothetical protein